MAKYLSSNPALPSPYWSVRSDISKSEPHAITPYLLFIALHVPLGALLHSSPTLSAAHALFSVAIGLLVVLLVPRDSRLYLLIVAYITGAEVLWRITSSGGGVPWELGKYSVFTIFLVALIRRGRHQKIPILPALYLVFLSTSSFLVFSEGFLWLRYRFIGNIMGPISLAIAMMYFENLHLDRKILTKISLILLAPVVSISAIVLLNTANAGSELRFGITANQLVSGGAANQVANALAMGILFCWLLFVSLRSSSLARSAVLPILGGLTIPLLLTFSRGGALTAGLAILITVPVALRTGSRRWTTFIVLLLLFVVVYVYVWPWLNEFTRGFASIRYGNLDSQRWDLARLELQIWFNNPIIGVGPGLAREHGLVTDFFGNDPQAHVEYTRLLAEHGILGFLALCILVVGFARNFLFSSNWEARTWIVALTVFVFLYMAQSATRTVAPSFLMGLTWAHLFESENL